MSEFATRTERWFEEVWHQCDASAIDRLLAPNAVIHGLNTDDNVSGPEAFHPFHEEFCRNFPRIHVNLNVLNSTADFETAWCEVSGSHNSGKQVSFTGIVATRFNEEGQIIEAWNCFDFQTMTQQLSSTEIEFVPDAMAH